MFFVNEYMKDITEKKTGTDGFSGLAVRGTGERVSDVGDILLAQPAQQGHPIIYHFLKIARLVNPMGSISISKINADIRMGEAAI